MRTINFARCLWLVTPTGTNMFLIQFSHLLLIHEKDADGIQEDTGHPHLHNMFLMMVMIISIKRMITIIVIKSWRGDNKLHCKRLTIWQCSCKIKTYVLHAVLLCGSPKSVNVTCQDMGGEMEDGEFLTFYIYMDVTNPWRWILSQNSFLKLLKGKHLWWCISDKLLSSLSAQCLDTKKTGKKTLVVFHVDL